MRNAYLCALAAPAIAGGPDVLRASAAATDPCLEQFNGRHPWIECRETFEPDAQAREAISEITFGMIRSANCHTNVGSSAKGSWGRI